MSSERTQYEIVDVDGSANGKVAVGDIVTDTGHDEPGNEREWLIHDANAGDVTGGFVGVAIGPPPPPTTGPDLTDDELTLIGLEAAARALNGLDPPPHDDYPALTEHQYNKVADAFTDASRRALFDAMRNLLGERWNDRVTEALTTAIHWRGTQ